MNTKHGTHFDAKQTERSWYFLVLVLPLFKTLKFSHILANVGEISDSRPLHVRWIRMSWLQHGKVTEGWDKQWPPCTRVLDSSIDPLINRHNEERFRLITPRKTTRVLTVECNARDMGQAFSRRRHDAGVRFRSYATMCIWCSGRTGSGMALAPSAKDFCCISVLTLMLHYHVLSTVDDK